MLSLEIDNPSPKSPKKKVPVGLWVLTFLIVCIPMLWMLVATVTAPQRVVAVPVGNLVYLDADQPSERTTMLRGLYLAGSNGSSQLLTHESEPQDTDAGSRIWITQPAVSPDGKFVAYIRQIYTLQQEHRTVSSELWMVGTPPGLKPQQVYDLSKEKLKGIIGLAWTSDSKAVAFTNDGQLYTAPITTGSSLKRQPLRGVPALVTNPDISATQLIRVTANSAPFYIAKGPGGSVVATGEKQFPATGPAAVSPDGISIAMAKPNRTIEILDAKTGAVQKQFAARWGWSPFSREITRLCFSPDGQYLAYSVSKRPVPEDEIFYLDLRNGQIRQLPERAGRAAWDWGP